MKMLRRGGGGWNFVCVLGGFENWWGQGEGVKSSDRTNGLITWAELAPFLDPGTLVKRSKNQLCDYMTTESARLAGIPVLWFRDPGR